MYESVVHKVAHTLQGMNVDNLFADAVKLLVPYNELIEV